MTTVGELVAVLRADSAQFVASMEEAQAQVGALKAESTGFSKAASTAFIAAGAIAVIAIAKMVDATVEWARAVKSLQNTTGQTAESASQLLIVGQQFGLSVTQMTTAFGIFEKNIVSGNKNIANFGLVTRDAQGQLLPFDQLLANAADTYVNLATQTQKTAFAQLVFGRSGRALIPILKQGAAGLEQLRAEAEKSNLVIGQGTVDAAVNLGIAERKLGEAFHGVAVSIGTEFLPIATKVIDWFVSVFEAAGRVSPVIPAVVLGLTALAGAGALLIRVGQGVVGAFASLFGGASAEVEASAAATDATVTLTGALTDLVAVLRAQAGAAIAAADATAVVADADAAAVGPTEALATAQKDLAASGAAAGESAAVSTGFFAGLLGMLTRVGAAAKAAAGPLGVALGAYALGSVSGTPKPSDTQAFNQAIGDFITAKQGLKAAMSGDTSISGMTTPEQWKAMAAGARSSALSLGAVGKALDYAAKHGVSYDEALTAVQKRVQGASSAQEAYSRTLKYVFSSMDAGVSSIADVDGAVNLLNAGLAANTGRMKSFASVSGQSTDAIMGNLAKVVNDAKSTPQQVADAYQGALDQMRQANQAWHDSIVQTFGGAGAAMDQFADKHVVDINKAIGSLQDYTKKIHVFDSDIKTIQKRFGKNASDFIQWASQQGLSQAALVHSVATSNKKNADSFIHQWGRAKGATDQLASDIQAALGPMFNKIIGWLKNVVRAIQGVPPVDIQAQVHDQELRTFDHNLAQLTSKTHYINIIAHTRPGSPWPDEALKQHLFDPLARSGFKKISGRWTLPLDIGVHSSMSPGGAHGSLSPIHYGNDPSSIAEMLMKQAGWKNNFQNVLDRVNAAGQSPNYIDKVTTKLADKLGPAAAKAFRSALTDLDVQSGRIDPRWMEQAVKNVSYIPAGHTNISTNHHNRGRGGGTRVILDRRHYDEQTSYQEDYGRGF